MANEKIRMKMTRHLDDKIPGDEIELDPAEARRYERSGAAVPATKPEAKRAGLSPDTAATAKS